MESQHVGDSKGHIRVMLASKIYRVKEHCQEQKQSRNDQEEKKKTRKQQSEERKKHKGSSVKG